MHWKDVLPPPSGLPLPPTATLQDFDSALQPIGQHIEKMSLLCIFFICEVLGPSSLSPKLLNCIMGHFWEPW